MDQVVTVGGVLGLVGILVVGLGTIGVLLWVLGRIADGPH